MAEASQSLPENSGLAWPWFQTHAGLSMEHLTRSVSGAPGPPMVSALLWELYLPSRGLEWAGTGASRAMQWEPDTRVPCLKVGGRGGRAAPTGRGEPGGRCGRQGLKFTGQELAREATVGRDHTPLLEGLPSEGRLGLQDCMSSCRWSVTGRSRLPVAQALASVPCRSQWCVLLLESGSSRQLCGFFHGDPCVVQVAGAGRGRPPGDLLQGRAVQEAGPRTWTPGRHFLVEERKEGCQLGRLGRCRASFPSWRCLLVEVGFTGTQCSGESDPGLRKRPGQAGSEVSTTLGALLPEPSRPCSRTSRAASPAVTPPGGEAAGRGSGR